MNQQYTDICSLFIYFKRTHGNANKKLNKVSNEFKFPSKRNRLPTHNYITECIHTVQLRKKK